MNVTVFDYGAGNLHSLRRALEAAGARVAFEADPERLLAGDLLVLPGVGAFGQAAARIAPARVRVAQALRDGHPCLGVCLGMQLLFDSSEEGAGQGLGFFGGGVRRLATRRVPHMGWNRIEWQGAAEPALRSAYFAHGYAADAAASHTVATAQHEGRTFAAAVAHARTLGVQFHPEKSGVEGVRWLAARVKGLARGESPACR
jgi:imidazole glycerol-phosphate synthase subunit HisH